MSRLQINDFGEIYSAYAAGCLDPAFALMLETQAALRPDVNAAVQRAETISATMLEIEPDVTVSTASLDAVFAMIDALEVEQTRRQHAAAQASADLEELLALPEPLRETALETCARTGWSQMIPGIRRLKLSLPSAAEVELYRIEPGRTVPSHSHRGNELTLVVSGGFSDETGHFGPGDVAIKGPKDTHAPTGDIDGVCFALAVRDGGLRFTGMMGFIQRLVGQ